MAQRIFNKMAGIIRGKKAEPDGFLEDSRGVSYTDQRVRADSEHDGAGASGSSDHNGLRPQAFDDNLKLSDLFRDEGENAVVPERAPAPVKSQIAVSPKFQQVAPMSRELTQSHSNQPAEMIPADLIETVGRENEGLRHRCEEVVRKVEEAATLRQDLSAVFSHVDVILKDLERTKTALAQRTAALAAERDGSNDLKARHRQLIGDHEQLRGEHVNLLGERQKHIDAVGDAEAQIGSLQDALSEKTKQFTDVTRRSEGDRERLSQADTDLRAAREEMQRTDDLIFSLQSDLSAARDHATLVEEDNKTLQVNLADARQQIARLARKENEAHAMLAAHKQRIDDLDLMVNSERVEHGKTRNLWQSESTNRRSDVSALQARLDAVTSRAEANDRLLAEARSLMHGKIEELRKAERRIQELQGAAAPLENKLQSMEQEHKSLVSRFGEMESQHFLLTEHAEGLTKSVRAKDMDAANWKQKLEALSDRFHIEMNRYEEERERFQQTIGRLGEQLEKEKLDRAMAEGALEVARKQRQSQSSLSTAARGREAASMAAAAAPAAAAEHGRHAPLISEPPAVEDRVYDENTDVETAFSKIRKFG